MTLLVVSPTERGGLGNTVEWVGRRAGWYWWKGRSLLCKGVKEGGCWWHIHKQNQFLLVILHLHQLNFLATLQHLALFYSLPAHLTGWSIYGKKALKGSWPYHNKKK